MKDGAIIGFFSTSKFPSGMSWRKVLSMPRIRISIMAVSLGGRHSHQGPAARTDPVRESPELADGALPRGVPFREGPVASGGGAGHGDAS
jgi:hypothetical protein